MVRCVLPLVLVSLLLPPTAFGQSDAKWDTEEPDKAAGERKTEQPADEGWETLKTGFKMVKKFEYVLPPVNAATAGLNTAVPDGAKQISTRLPLPSKALTITVDGKKLGVDLNGDLKPDVWCKGERLETEVMLEYPDGTKAQYGVEILRGSTNWTMSRSCYRYFSLKGEQISLIDNDSDGHYDTFGTDALIVGRRPYAQYLSSMIAVRGKVYEMKLNRAGTEVQVREWTGETGKVNMAKGWKGAGHLAAAMLIDGTRCFDAAGPTIIPIGKYSLKWGVLTDGGRMCKYQGNKTLDVTADGEASLDFGKTFKLDFAVSRDGDKVTVAASSLRVTCDAGYEYYDFNRKLLPHVQIRDKENQKTVAKGKIGTAWWGTPTQYTGRVPADQKDLEYCVTCTDYIKLLGPLDSGWQTK